MTTNSPSNHLVLQATYKQIGILFFPIVFSFFIPQINAFTNSYFISKMGELHLASYTIVSVYYLIFAVIGIGFNAGLQMLMAQYAGASNYRSFEQYFNNGNTFGLLFSVFGILFTFIFLEPILRLVIVNQEILNIAIPFIQIRIWGLPFLYLYLSRNALFINANKAHLLIVTSIVETLVNIFLDYALIFGQFYFPALGIQGAAIASIFAEAIGYGMSLLLIQFSIKKVLPLKYGFNVNVKIFKHLFYTSLPLIMQFLFAVVSWQIFFILIENVGKRELAISGILRVLIMTFGVLPWAMGQTANTIVNNLIGQNKKEEMIIALKKILTVAFLAGLFFSITVYFFRTFILQQFTNDATFIRDAQQPLLIILIAVIAMSIGSVLLNTIIGLGNTKINLYIEMIAVSIYLAYIFYAVPTYRSLSWAWASEIIYWVSMSVLSFLYFLKWKKNASMCV